MEWRSPQFAATRRMPTMNVIATVVALMCVENDNSTGVASNTAATDRP